MMFDDFPNDFFMIAFGAFNTMLDVPFETSRGLEQSRPSRVADEPVSQENGLWCFVTSFYSLFVDETLWSAAISCRKRWITSAKELIPCWDMQQHRLNGRRGTAAGTCSFFSKPCHSSSLLAQVLGCCNLRSAQNSGGCSRLLLPWKKRHANGFVWGSYDTLIVGLCSPLLLGSSGIFRDWGLSELKFRHWEVNAATKHLQYSEP